MNKNIGKRLSRRGKTVLAVLIAVMFIGVASAALIPHFGVITTTATVDKQAVEISADGIDWKSYNDPIEYTISDAAPSGTYCFKQWIRSSASVPVDVTFTNNDPTGITTTYWKEVNTPTIDGVIDAGEWDGFLWFDETLTNFPYTNPVDMAIKIYMMNDCDNLYIALDIPDTFDMRSHPEAEEGGSDTFGLNIGVEGDEASYRRVLQFNTARYPNNPEKREDWTELDGYLALWSVAINDVNGPWGPDTENLPIPEGVQSKTIFDETHRVQEIAIPLSDLDVSLGDVIRVGGCIRAAEFGGYNFHALYPEGLDWGVASTYKNFAIGSEILEGIPFPMQPGDQLQFRICHKFALDIAKATYNLATKVDATETP